MVIATSDSCNTLVSLDNDVKRYTEDGTSSYWSQDDYCRTSLLLPDDRGDDHAVVPVYLPEKGRVDEYLRNIPCIVESADQLLANKPVSYDTKSKESILYVGQGEVAHAVPRQCDVIVSDRATTCHILALRSATYGNDPLASMAHIDATSYDVCVRTMFQQHVHHHYWSAMEEHKDDFTPSDSRIVIEAHILGGFEDKDSTSAEISNWLMWLLADLSEEYRDSVKVVLKTCAISSLNENGYSGPIGRGLAMRLSDGEVFLANTVKSIMGPAPELRAVRRWSGAKGLSLIHSPHSNEIAIDSFNFNPMPEANQLLCLPDYLLLQCTSTSPEVEEDDFCDSVRSTIKFVNGTSCREVFGSDLKRRLVYQRVERSNTWKLSF